MLIYVALNLALQQLFKMTQSTVGIAVGSNFFPLAVFEIFPLTEDNLQQQTYGSFSLKIKKIV